MVAVDIYAFLDYREYLKTLYKAEKEQGKHFSFRYFAKVAGFGSPSYLKMVMEGQRNLKVASIAKFARALKLGKKEASYFETLVLFNQASTETERDASMERLTALRPAIKLTGLAREKYEYFRHKYFVVIREMVALPDFQEDSEWIARHVVPAIRPRDAEHALKVLLHLGLIKRGRNGRLAQTDVSLTTPVEVNSIDVCNFHRGMLGDAKEAIVRFKPENREISSVTIPVPLTLLPKIKKKVQDFQEEIMDYINRSERPYDEVFQMNLQLFPVTNIKLHSKD